MSNVPEFNYFSKHDEEQVLKLIMKTKSKLCELVGIPTSLLKRISPPILPIKPSIINSSLQSDSFLRNWKPAIVTLLIKKHGMELVKSSYTPVSNLSYISKLVEKAMLDQINHYCHAHNLLPDYQSAYRGTEVVNSTAETYQ